MAGDGFYAALGPAGLADIAPPLTAADLRWLRRLLAGRRDVLDAGCGYGRVAIPLAEAGHHVTGFDLDPALIADARRRARGHGLPLRFRTGDIRRRQGGAYDAVLCLWSTFQHLLTIRDRRACLAACHAALRPGGLLVLEMTDAGVPAVAHRLARDGQGPDRRIAAWRLHGATIRCYLHDRDSLARCFAATPFVRVRIASRQVGAVRRLVALAWKAPSR